MIPGRARETLRLVAHFDLTVNDDLALRLEREAQRLRIIADRSRDPWPDRFFEEICGFLKEDIEEPAAPSYVCSTNMTGSLSASLKCAQCDTIASNR